jgi:hypothetical protein
MVLIQMLTRPGFDVRRHPLSLLSLGDLGWIQIAAFVATGLAGIACAVGMRQALRCRRGGTWGPLLVGLWGLGLIAAGAFHPDPSLGFPPGTAQDMPEQLSWHAIFHGVAFFTLFTSLALASMVFARRFAGHKQWNWMAYSTATGVAAPAIVALGMSNPSAAAIPFALAGVVAFGWLSVVSRALLTELRDQTESQ